MTCHTRVAFSNVQNVSRIWHLTTTTTLPPHYHHHTTATTFPPPTKSTSRLLEIVILSNAMSSYVTLRYVMSCYATGIVILSKFPIVDRQAIAFKTKALLYPITFQHPETNEITCEDICYFMLCHAALCHIILCHVMVCY
jgi:hypothetical protein